MEGLLLDQEINVPDAAGAVLAEEAWEVWLGIYDY